MTHRDDEFDLSGQYDDSEFDLEPQSSVRPKPKKKSKKARKRARRIRNFKILGLVAAVVVLATLAVFFLHSGTPGSKVLEEYAKIATKSDKQLWVLQQVADGNMPGTWNDWVTIKTKGSKGTEVEFEASPHGLRLGTSSDWVEIPLDGPHSAAAAEILDCKLATAWMVKQIHLQAMKEGEGKVVKFFAAPEIAEALGIKWNPNRPDGEAMESPEFILVKNVMLHAWLAGNKVSDGMLVSGYFKSVVQPVEGMTNRSGKTSRLEIVGGYNDKGKPIQGLSGGFHWEAYFDYSHNIRLVKDEMKVNGETMTMNQFFSTSKYAVEFGFRRSKVPARAYPYPADLAAWMKEHGYLTTE